MVLGIDPGRPCRPISILASIYLIYIYGFVEIKADEGVFFTYRLVGKGRFDIADRE